MQYCESVCLTLLTICPKLSLFIKVFADFRLFHVVADCWLKCIFSFFSLFAAPINPHLSEYSFLSCFLFPKCGLFASSLSLICSCKLRARLQQQFLSASTKLPLPSSGPSSILSLTPVVQRRLQAAILPSAEWEVLAVLQGPTPHLNPLAWRWTRVKSLVSCTVLTKSELPLGATWVKPRRSRFSEGHHSTLLPATF